MEVIVPVVILLAIVAFVLGRARDSSLARKIGTEVRDQAPADDPVVLLDKLHSLYLAGGLTEDEYQSQKARILGQSQT